MKAAKRMTLGEVKRELAEVARVGQMFVDGDLCRAALQPYAVRFMTGDDLDFNPETSVPLKKTLMRLERLARVPVSVVLWRRRPDMPDSGEALLFGSNGPPEGAAKPPNRGYKPPKMTKEMRAVFLRGESAWKVERKAGDARNLVRRGLVVRVRGVKADTAVELFVPVKDSMGEVAAALEVFTVVSGR